MGWPPPYIPSCSTNNPFLLVLNLIVYVNVLLLSTSSIQQLYPTKNCRSTVLYACAIVHACISCEGFERVWDRKLLTYNQSSIKFLSCPAWIGIFWWIKKWECMYLQNYILNTYALIFRHTIKCMYKINKIWQGRIA
jgi:hypothetical protein